MSPRALSLSFWILGAMAAPAAARGPQERAVDLVLQPDPPPPVDLAPHSWRLERGEVDVRAGGRLVLDGIRYGHENARHSGLEVDRATASVQGNLGRHLGFSVEVDLLGVDTRDHLFEAFAALRLGPELRVRAGQVRFALGSEFATEPLDEAALGYSFPSYLDGRHDAGVVVDGELLGEALWYEAGYAAGTGFDPAGRKRESAQAHARLVVHPLAGMLGRTLYVGAAVAHGERYADLVEAATPVENTVLQTRELDGGDALWLHGEAGLHWRFLRIAFEQVRGRFRDVQGTDEGIAAYSISASLFLNGTAPTWARGRWQPVSFHEGSGLFPSAGPLELALRYSRASLDRDLFLVAASPPASARTADTFTATFHWHYHPRLRAGLSYVESVASEGLVAFGGSQHDRSFVLRLDLRF